MVKYHVNPDTGGTGLCKAIKDPCPFGGETGTDNHYNTEAEAIEAGEKLLTEKYGTINTETRKKQKSVTINNDTVNYDEELLEGLSSFKIVINNKKTKFISAFENIYSEQGKPLPYDRISPQSVASKSGYLFERVIVNSLNRDFKDTDRRAYLGEELSDKIKYFRYSVKTGKNVSGEMKAFADKYHIAYEDLIGYVTDSKKKLSLPDVVIVDNETGIIKTAELKASGDNDSSSVPENLDKMVPNSRNSAVDLWNNTDYKLDKALLIVAANGENGHYPTESRWNNSLEKNRPEENITIASNENAYNWLSNKKVSDKSYEKTVINTVARTIYNALEKI